MREPLYEFWLSDIRGIGCRKIKAMLEYFGTPEEIFKAQRSSLNRLLHFVPEISRL